MSTAQLSFDEYTFPGPRSPHPYDMAYSSLGGVSHSQLYPHSHIEASSSGAHTHRHTMSHLAEPMYSSLFPDNQEQQPTQQYMPSEQSPFFDPLYSQYHIPRRAPSPSNVYVANGWNGTNSYSAVYNPQTSAAFLQNLQSVIDSSHTVQTQQANIAANTMSQHTSAGSSPPSGTLSGSLDPITGVFQRSAEHPRLRIAQACEKCRQRKAKCSGEQPCARCYSRGLQCEYALERKMRGPNKQKRKNANINPDATPAPSKRMTSVALSEPGSDDNGRSADASPVLLQPELASASSARSSPIPDLRSSPGTVHGARPRSKTVASGAIPRMARSTIIDESAQSPRPGTESGTRPRPPPLNLETTPNFSQVLAGYLHGQEQSAPFPPEQSEQGSAPLPPYLLETYSRMGLDAPLDASNDMLNTSPADAFSIYSHTRSDSSDVSAPITPLSLAFEASGGLYSQDDSSFSSFATFHHSGLPENTFSGDLQPYVDSPGGDYRSKSAEATHGWDMAAMHAQMAQDGTPRALQLGEESMQ